MTKGSKTKISIDFDKNAIKKMNEYKEVYQKSNTTVINELIDSFLGINKTIQEQLINCCQKIRLKNQKNQGTSEYQRKETEEIERQCCAIIQFYGRNYDPLPNMESMRKIEIADGTVVFPDDWVVLKENIAYKCRYVGVIETRNADKYGVPHFLFFSEIPINYISNTDVEKVLRQCGETNDQFKLVLEKRVELIKDGEGNLLNETAWSNAPTPGVFVIQDYDQSRNISNYPCGAMIIRK